MAGRKRFVADPPRRGSLGSGNSDIAEGRTDVGEQSGKIVPERLCADGDGEGDEDNEHGVFGGGGTTLVTVKATDEIEHLSSPTGG